MDNWDEMRTAFEVVRHGTVSGAAHALGVHHATVIRHVDALEHRLGVKLFQRHARGYTPTEAGQELARVAQATDDQFSQLSARLSGQGSAVSGDLVVTTLTSFSPRIVPLLAQFQLDYPEVTIHYRTGTRLFRLEYGEAHVAIRAGNPPQEPDNVVQHLADMAFAPFASPAYIERMGMPTPETFAQHHFVGLDEVSGRPPFMDWIDANIPAENVRFRAPEDNSLVLAAESGIGIGFLAVDDARPDMVQLAEAVPDWASSLWLVTHVDLHRTAKVQALTGFLKTALKDCG